VAPALAPLAPTIEAALARLGRVPELAPHADPPDFLGFLRAIGQD